MADTDKLKIAFIVLNHNGLEDTVDCLESLRKCTVDKYHVEFIAVDNASNDGSREALSKWKDIDLIANQDNLGFSGGNNLGIKRALLRGANFIVILNNDTVVDKSFIVNLTPDFAKYDIVSPKIYFAGGFEFHKKRYKKNDLGKVIWYAGAKIDWQNIIGVHIGVDEVDHGQFAKGYEIDLATGACMIVKREIFEKIGFFDDKYFLYLEDADFCVRAKKAGFRIFFEPKAVIWHKNASSVGGSGSKIQDYYITRNRLLFAFKYAPVRTKIAVFRQIISQARDPIKRRALIDFLTFRLGRGSLIV